LTSAISGIVATLTRNIWFSKWF